MATKQEIQRKALRAALAVTFTIGALACGSEPVANKEEKVSADGSTVIADGGAGDSGSDQVADAGEDVFVADAGAVLSDCLVDGGTDWDCCEAQGWQPPAHCTPWGPPAPPAIAAARLAADARLVAERA